MPAKKRRLSPRKQPTQERSKDLVELLLKATARILIRDGLAGLNTNKVADVAGVSIGSIYQYFSNKDSLISGLIQRKLMEDRTFFEEKMIGFETWNFERKISTLVSAGIELHRRDHKLLKVLFEQLGGSGQLELLGFIHKQMFEMIQLMIAERSERKLKEDEVFEKSYLAQQLILGVWHSQVEKEWMKVDANSITRRTYKMIETLCAD